jgi:hypothetical protein
MDCCITLASRWYGALLWIFGFVLHGLREPEVWIMCCYLTIYLLMFMYLSKVGNLSSRLGSICPSSSLRFPGLPAMLIPGHAQVRLHVAPVSDTLPPLSHCATSAGAYGPDIQEKYTENRKQAIIYAPRSLAVNLTRKLGFCHNINTLCSSHSPSPTLSTSNAHTNLAKILLNSAHARLWPMQFLGPTLKGWITCLLSFSYSFSPRKRSGANVCGLAKCCEKRFMEYCGMPICVPPGIKWPHTVAPAAGMMRGRDVGKGG